MNKIKKITYLLLEHSRHFRKMMSFLFPSNTDLKMKILELNYLEQLIYSYYDEESIKDKRFYNIGAGDQRSKFNFWSYVDLETSKYNKNGIDILYDLEALSPIPLPDTHAEVIFNSFVIEHISVEATKNLCREAFRTLKKGGVFHSKVHSYEYGIKLLNKNLISPKIPFQARESSEHLKSFIRAHNNKVKSYFNEKNEYVVESLKDSDKKITFDAGNAFIYHNAVASMNNIFKSPTSVKDTLNNLNAKNLDSFYSELKDLVDVNEKQPHQHNADYFSKEDLLSFIKDLGFSEVYFTQPYQSVSPALWEDRLNPIHSGFLYSIEAVK